MFTEVQKESIAKTMDLTTQELDTFVRRFNGHLNAILEKKDFIAHNDILHGLKIIKLVQNDSLIEKQQKREYINFGSMRNEFIKKYAVKILELRDNDNYGAQRISTYFQVHHKVSLAKATIDRFLKLNKVENND